VQRYNKSLKAENGKKKKQEKTHFFKEKRARACVYQNLFVILPSDWYG
jgi:hypothetical protein